MGAHEPFQVPLRRLWNHPDTVMRMGFHRCLLAIDFHSNTTHPYLVPHTTLLNAMQYRDCRFAV